MSRQAKFFKGTFLQITAWSFLLVLQELHYINGLMWWKLCNIARDCVWDLSARKRELRERRREREKELGREIREDVCQTRRERNSRHRVGRLKNCQSPFLNIIVLKKKKKDEPGINKHVPIISTVKSILCLNAASLWSEEINLHWQPEKEVTHLAIKHTFFKRWNLQCIE